MLAVNGPLRQTLRRLPHGAVRAGLPPKTLGWRWVTHRPLDAATAEAAGGTYARLADETVVSNPLPANVLTRSELPRDSGWWGFSFHDVPRRVSGETALVTLPDATLAFHEDAAGEIDVGLLDRAGNSLTLREIRFRPHHAPAMRRPPTRLADALWIFERVYHNHSHWLTAHLPKLCLARELGLAERLVLPERRTRIMDESLRLLGFEPEAMPVVPLDRPLRVGALGLFRTDRFRPELLRRARAALARPVPADRSRRLYISRARAGGRRLINEAEIWPLFRAAGFERVHMEELGLAEQIGLLAGADAIAGPHGAGLSNQIFCPEGTRVLEIADPGFPNPNVYATAAALGHRFALASARGVGSGPERLRDLEADPAEIARALACLAL